MITDYLWAGLGIGFVFSMSCLGSATVLIFPQNKSRKMQQGLMGFSAGLMTAASVWSLLLPAIEQTGADGDFPLWLPAVVGILAGAAFVGGIAPGASDAGCSKLFGAVTLHNIPEGMAVGLAFALAGDGAGIYSALSLAFGIGVQNFPEGAAVSLPIYQSGQSRFRAFMKGFFSAAVEPVSALLAILAASRLYALMPWLLSFSAGAMLLVAVDELLPEAPGIWGSTGYIGGFALMMLLDTALG